MKIIWRDTELKTHEIDLTNAVDMKIDGITISLINGEGIRINTDNILKIIPVANNAVLIKENE